MLDKPTNVIFQPILIEAKYKTKFKVQIAFYRSTKVSKTEPLLFNDPTKPIALNGQLTLSTTLPFNRETNVYLDKEVDIQMAYEIEIKPEPKQKFKELLNTKINLKDYVSSDPNKLHRLVMKNDPTIVLIYKIKLDIKDDLLRERINEDRKEQKDQQTLQIKREFKLKKMKSNQNETEQIQREKSIQKKIRFENPVKDDDSPQLQRKNTQKNRYKTMTFPENQLKVPQPQIYKIHLLKSPNNSDEQGPKFTNIPIGKSNGKALGQKKIDVKEQEPMKSFRQNAVIPPVPHQDVQKLVKKCREKQKRMDELQNEKKTLMERITELQRKLKQKNIPCEKCNDLQSKTRQFENRIKQTEIKLKQYELKNKEVQSKLLSEVKLVKSYKDQLKKQQANRKHFEAEMDQSKEEVEQYKKTIQNLTKALSQNIASNNSIPIITEVQLKNLKDKLRNSQKIGYQAKKEVEELELSMHDKDDIIRDLRSKIFQMDKELLELTTNSKNIQSRFLVEKNELESHIADLQTIINEMKEEVKELKDLKKGSTKDIGDTADLKKKTENLIKQLEKKEELIKKIMDMKKESEYQYNAEILNLKKQMQSLKDAMGKQQEKPSSDSSSNIEHKIQAQKMKKELQAARKNEKNLLIEKSQLQKRNKTMQQDIVKNKECIANILNAVQQSGVEGLISEVYNFI